MWYACCNKISVNSGDNNSEYLLGVSGTYKVDVKLGGTAVIGSPFLVKSYDISRVRVFGLSDGVVNKTTTFTGSYF